MEQLLAISNTEFEVASSTGRNDGTREYVMITYCEKY